MGPKITAFQQFFWSRINAFNFCNFCTQKLHHFFHFWMKKLRKKVFISGCRSKVLYFWIQKYDYPTLDPEIWFSISGSRNMVLHFWIQKYGSPFLDPKIWFYISGSRNCNFFSSISGPWNCSISAVVAASEWLWLLIQVLCFHKRSNI